MDWLLHDHFQEKPSRFICSGKEKRDRAYSTHYLQQNGNQVTPSGCGQLRLQHRHTAAVARRLPLPSCSLSHRRNTGIVNCRPEGQRREFGPGSC